MTDIKSEKSEVQQETPNSRVIEENDLYKHIPPPIPLIPKNKYTDDLPKSFYSML